MNLKKQLFLELSDYLQQKLQLTDGTPSVQWIDKDLGQFEMMQEGMISLPLPAVLIAFPDTAYENILSKDQTGTGIIRLRIGFENYYEANSASPDRTLALQFFDFNEAVNNNATAFKMQGIGTLKRIGEAEDLNHGAVIITEITYQYSLYDTFNETGQTVNMSADLKVRIVEDARPNLDTDWQIPQP